MLTDRQLATLRAALLYWQEEICPHGPAVARPYLEPTDALPLTDAEITALRQHLEAGVRYAIVDPSRDRLDGTELFDELAEAQLAAGKLPLATVILPAV